MNNVIDAELFLQIIESEGAIKLYTDELEGVTYLYYLGLSGKRIALDITDGVFSERTATSWLKLLGMSDLINRMFTPCEPDQKVKEWDKNMPVIIADEENKSNEQVLEEVPTSNNNGNIEHTGGE